MRIHPGHLVLLAAPLLLSACGSSSQKTTALLQYRLQARLAGPVAANQATLTPQPDGASVTLLQPPPIGQDLDEKNSVVLASVVEGMLDPSLMRVQVADSSDLGSGERVRTVNQYFEAYNLGGTLRPAVTAVGAPPAPAGAAPAGLTIRVSVACPDTTAGSNWGYRVSQPRCD